MDVNYKGDLYKQFDSLCPEIRRTAKEVGVDLSKIPLVGVSKELKSKMDKFSMKGDSNGNG